MVGPFQAPGAAESDASVRLRGRSHVPGTRRNRAQAEEAGIWKAKLKVGLLPKERDPKRDASRLGRAPTGETEPVGTRTQSAYGPSSAEIRPMNRLRRTSAVDATLLGCGSGGGNVRSVYAPEPPLCVC
jgi:hypothetical protein